MSEKVTLYKFQLQRILDTLILTARINESKNRISAWDRSVMESLGYAKNAMLGNIDAKSERFCNQSQEDILDE